jgi:hypothetical protein
MMPENAAGPLGVALGLLCADLPGQVMGAPQDWPRWAVLLPHVLTATGHLDSAGQPDPEMMADGSWLLDRAGTYLRVHVRLADAKALLERALAIDEAAYGPDHPEVPCPSAPTRRNAIFLDLPSAALTTRHWHAIGSADY